MSGVFGAVTLGAQNPVLKGATLSHNVPTAGGSVILRVRRAGTLGANFEGLPNSIEVPGEWAGPVPTATIGDTYEVRVNNVSGTALLGDGEFSPMNVWLALTSDRSFKDVNTVAGSSKTVTVRVEIRRASNLQVLASGLYTLVFFPFG